MFQSERLDRRHDTSRFASGHPQLDDWLRRFAIHADAKRQGRTYVWHDGDQVVVAYFTLSPHVIQRAQLPGRLARGDPDLIPALLLARLALDRGLHGRKLGSELLLDALGRAVAASNRIGGRYLVVDAIDDPARGFYAHHSFLPCGEPGTARYVRKISDIEVSLTRDRG